MVDSDNRGKHTQVCTIADTSLRDNSHAGALYDLLCGRLKSQQALGGVDRGSETFNGANTLKSLTGKDGEEWTIAWLSSKIDVSQQELISIHNKNPDQLAQIMSFGTQIAYNTRLPGEFQAKPIASRVVQMRIDACGDSPRTSNCKRMCSQL